jgi:hypothetical protein
MYEQIFLTILSFVVLFVTKNTPGLFPKIIVVGILLSYLLSFGNDHLIKSFALILYILSSLLGLIYVLTKRMLLLKEKLLYGSICLLSFYGNAGKLLHLKYANETLFLGLIAACIYCIYLIQAKFRLKPENGFMVLLSVGALFRAPWLF